MATSNYFVLCPNGPPLWLHSYFKFHKWSRLRMTFTTLLFHTMLKKTVIVKAKYRQFHTSLHRKIGCACRGHEEVFTYLITTSIYPHSYAIFFAQFSDMLKSPQPFFPGYKFPIFNLWVNIFCRVSNMWPVES